MQIISGISTAFYFWLQPGQSFSSSWLSCYISPPAADINQHTVLMSYFPILFLEQLVKQAPWQSVSQVIYHETVWPNVDHCLATIPMLTASHSFPIPHLPIVELLLFSRQVMSNSFVTLWTVACQTPLSKIPLEFSRQESCSGLPFSTPGDLPDPGIEPVSFASPTLVSGFFTASATWEACPVCFNKSSNPRSGLLFLTSSNTFGPFLWISYLMYLFNEHLSNTC